jgi:hypothetical protein
MSGYTPEGFNGDEERDWATDPEAPKAQMRTKEQFLGLTRGEILKLSGADLDTACALLCMDDVTRDEEDRVWMRSNGDTFRPSSSLSHAALACDAMIKRGYGISVFLDVDGAECCISKDGEDDVWTYLHKTEAEARTMACVLASWKDGQHEQ